MENNVGGDNLEALHEQEKIERLARNKVKCLAICIKIENDLNSVIDKLKVLSLKKQQSVFVLMGMVKYSLKMIFPQIISNEELITKYIEVVRLIFNKIINIENDCFLIFKSNLIKSIETKNWDEMQHLIFNYEIDETDRMSVRIKSLSINGVSEFNTSTSTKIDNNLEISVKDVTSQGTSRNFNIVSPTYNDTDASSSSKIKIMKNDNIKFTNIRTKLPFIILAVDVTISAIQVKKIFMTEMKNQNTIIKGNESNDFIYAEKDENNFFSNIFRCIRYFTRRNDEKTVMQFSIKYSDNKYERLIELKGISGNKDLLNNMILSFVKNLAKKVKKMRIIRNSLGFKFENFLKEQKEKISTSKKVSGANYKYESLTDEDNNSLVDNSNKEASNFYEFYRILSQENYDLGKSVRDFLDSFKHKYKHIEESQRIIPKQMEDIMKFIEECVSTFFCYFNFGKSNTEKMLPYCRPAVEKYIFNKLYFLLYDIYNRKYQEENQKFVINQNRIRVKLKTEEIMDFLEINKKFRGNDRDFYIPYKSTIDCINKIEYEQTPKDKFDTLMKASLELRNCILDITKGKAELCSMDDELPLFIYITTQINVKNIVIELNMIEDYLRFSKSIDKESKVVTNIMSAVYYISNTWSLDDK